METCTGNEEEQEQETTQIEGGRVGKTGAREGGEDSKAVRGVVKKHSGLAVYIHRLDDEAECDT